MPIAHGQCGSVLQELHCPWPPGGVVVRYTSCTAHTPLAVRQCIARLPLPTAPKQ